MTPSPVSAPVSKKPSGCSTGCLVALLIVGGVVVIAGLIGAFALYRAASSPEGQKVMKALGKGAQLASKGLNGPGAQEVRNAGCPETFLLDVNEMMDLVDLFSDAGTKAPTTGVMVICQAPYGTLPDCGTVAKAYVAAPGRPAGEFVVMVKLKNEQKEQCARRYADSGEDLGDFKK